MNKIPPKSVLKQMPGLGSVMKRYDNFEIGLNQIPVKMHFYTNDQDWYMIEYGGWPRRFFCFMIYDKSNPKNSDFTIIKKRELASRRAGDGSEVVWDEYWTPKRLFDIQDIRRSYGKA